MQVDAFTAEQVQALRRNGYVVLPGIVPMALVRAAQGLIYRALGR